MDKIWTPNPLLSGWYSVKGNPEPVQIVVEKNLVQGRAWSFPLTRVSNGSVMFRFLFPFIY